MWVPLQYSDTAEMGERNVGKPVPQFMLICPDGFGVVAQRGRRKRNEYRQDNGNRYSAVTIHCCCCCDLVYLHGRGHVCSHADIIAGNVWSKAKFVVNCSEFPNS